MDKKPVTIRQGVEINMPEISSQIWRMKYQLKGADGTPIDKTVEDTWARVANALAAPEVDYTQRMWTKTFYRALNGFKFMPGGRIIAGAGVDRDVTLFNCFVLGTIPDSMDGIFSALREAALTMQAGGGIGYDFSTLRPKGAAVHGVGADASGPLSFMDCWNTMCSTVESAGYRRGAMMATMRVDHPDIEAFIEAKADRMRLRQFNLSVLVTDAFMQAVREDAAWPLAFGGKVYKTISARGLWGNVMRSTYAYAEPGVIFIDRINQMNNLHYCERINATNPCGEQPLPPYGNCLLGSLNLAMMVEEPFTSHAGINTGALREIATTAVRMFDNVIEISKFPLPQQREEAFAKRRIGLGVTGLADALIMCGLRYGSPEAVAITEKWLSNIEAAAYLASADLAAEKGSFPLYDRDKYLAGKHVINLGQSVREAIAEKGMRNSHLTSIAPTGTISNLGFNVSSGIEPVFSLKGYTRKLLMPDGSREEREVVDYAVHLWRQLRGNHPLPSEFVDVESLVPMDHLRMLAAAQKYVDASISKTINLPEDIPFDTTFQGVYAWAYENGCKSCTTYRPNEITGSVLSTAPRDSGPAPTNHPSPLVGEDSGIVYLQPMFSRPAELPGKTYKVKWPDSDHALYVTVNDIEEHGRKRPWEVFLISNEAEADEWRVALGRMISAVYRRGGDVAFIAAELKAIADKKGGAWIGGKRLPSIIASIGDVIERHMQEIGFTAQAEPVILSVDHAVGADFNAGGKGMRQCPKCGEVAMVRIENCDQCVSCAYSKCS